MCFDNESIQAGPMLGLLYFGCVFLETSSWCPEQMSSMRLVFGNQRCSPSLHSELKCSENTISSASYLYTSLQVTHTLGRAWGWAVPRCACCSPAGPCTSALQGDLRKDTGPGWSAPAAPLSAQLHVLEVVSWEDMAWVTTPFLKPSFHSWIPIETVSE